MNDIFFYIVIIFGIAAIGWNLIPIFFGRRNETKCSNKRKCFRWNKAN